MFNKPGQMCVDSEGNIILTDTENHCIRKITMSTGYVSTLAGKPQNSGYVMVVQKMLNLKTTGNLY